MCGGGGGGDGTQRYEWNDGVAPYWERALGVGNALSNLGLGGEGNQYQQYGGQRIADINDDQQSAMDGIRHYVGSGGYGPYSESNWELQRTLGGDYLNGENSNPFSQLVNPWQNVGSVNEQSAAGHNEYSGDNPFFRNMLDTGLNDIASAYKRGTSADTTRMFNLAGAFGGSAHQQAVANNEAQLGKTLSNFTDSMANKQFDRSAGLAESELGRAFTGQEAYHGRQFQGSMRDKELGGQWYQDMLGRASGNHENERNRMLGAVPYGQADQGLTFQRMQQLMGIGDIQRGYNQDYLNLDYSNWQQQQQHPYQMLDYMTGLLSRAQGGVSPNMTYTQPGYQASPYSSLLGMGLMGYGMMN